MSNTNDFIRDANGMTYRIGTLLGRGLFAKSYTARGEDAQEWVVKVSLSQSDFPPEMAHLVKISRSIMDEQWQLLSRKSSKHLVVPIHHFISEDGRYCLVYPRHDHTFRQHLGQLRSLQDILRLFIRFCATLMELPTGLFPHGNLHSNNIFWNGEHPVLMDPLTPLLCQHHTDLLKARGFHTNTPPEYRAKRPKKTFAPEIATDTYALCLLFVSRLVHNCESDIITQGWNKVIEHNIQQSVQLLLQQNPSTNQHFHDRVIRQLLRLFDRGLSRSAEPSPPYRFDSITDFQQRLQFITDLINPTISKVGPILFSGPLGKGTFEQEDEVRFSCSIQSIPALEDYEDITCGTILLDLNRNHERVTDYDLWVDAKRLTGGRLRFELGIRDLQPGDYGLVIGFRVNGSLAAPKQNEAQFEVTAKPGYAPKNLNVPPKTLQFPSTRIETQGAIQTPAPTQPLKEAKIPLHTVQPQTQVFNIDPFGMPYAQHTERSHGQETTSDLPKITPTHSTEQGSSDSALTKSSKSGPSRSASSAVIRIPNLDSNRTRMQIPDSEFAPLSNSLSSIQPLKSTPSQTSTPSSLSKTVSKMSGITTPSTTSKGAMLAVVPSQGTEPNVGAFHQSPFKVTVETLIEVVDEVFSEEFESESEFPNRLIEEHSMSESQSLPLIADDAQTDDLTSMEDPYTEEGFSVEPESQEHAQKHHTSKARTPQPDASPDSPSIHPDDEVHDVLKDMANRTKTWVKNDPFASTIIGLIVIIVLLGGVILAL